MMRRTVFLMLFGAVLVACASPHSQVMNPCLEYNQGTRVTSNREWPAAVRQAEKLKRQMRLATLPISTEGPDRYDRLAENYQAVLEPAIRNAGTCYTGSLFEGIVVRMTREAERIEESAEHAKARWRDGEEKRMSREAAVNNLPDEVKRHEFSDVEVEILELRSSGRTTFKLQLTNVSEGRIIRAVTGRFWGYDADSPEMGGIAPTGFSLSDNYGNSFSLNQTRPERTGRSDAGLHPGNSEVYEIIFVGRPPTTASEVTLTIWRGTFGNDVEHKIILPRRAFLP